MNQSSDPVQPLNAFAEEYLTLLREREEVPTAFEAERAGPWKIVKTAEGFGLFRLWESPEKGFAPQAVFKDRPTALLFLAVWPLAGRSPVYRTVTGEGGAVEVVETSGESVVRLSVADDHLLEAANVAAWLVRLPFSLAVMAEAGGPGVQEMMGQLLRDGAVQEEILAGE
jgi:hypothetical protein